MRLARHRASLARWWPGLLRSDARALIAACVTVLLLHKDSVRSVMIKGDLVESGEAERGVATQA